MLFWKKTASQEILEDLKSIGIHTSQLRKFETKRNVTKKIINGIKSNIIHAKHEIRERAEEEKSKVSIDARFDPEIDIMANEEVTALNKLESDLVVYRELVNKAEDETELNDVINILSEEETKIVEREKDYREKLEAMSHETIDERMSRSSDRPPNLKTYDGTSWIKISIVCRQLGGWVVCGGRSHICELRFPNHIRPVPFSEDVATIRLAQTVRPQLRHLPARKIPSTHKLTIALKAGDIRKAE